MIFVIDNLKYDTDKMELISEKCKYSYTLVFTLTNTEMRSYGKDVKLWKSKKGNQCYRRNCNVSYYSGKRS